MLCLRFLPPILFSLLASSLAQSTHASAAKTATGLWTLPRDAQGPISAALGKNDSSYWIHRNANGFRGENPRHVLAAEFTRQGAEVRSSKLRWALETRAFGYGDALHPVKAVPPQAKANRVEYRRDGLTEWYENGPLGLEQGFTLSHPPGKRNGQPLTVELWLRGDFVAAPEPAASDKSNTLALRGRDGKAALRYTGLSARDATGRELRSWLELNGERLLVRVEDGGARYPLMVDPWIQQAELTASDGAAQDEFGHSVAVSGGTILVGAWGHYVGSNADQGAAYVFVQSGTTWTQQAELTASDGAPYDFFGWSVALDGGTALVGAEGQGAAYVFVQSGTTWTQQAELTAGAAGGAFGDSVALSGATAVVGAPADCASTTLPGAAYVFVQSGTTWTQQAELLASDGAANDCFGYSVAVTANVAAVGALYHAVGSNARQGAAYVFAQSGTTWTQQAELTASDGAAYDYLGSSVAVTASAAVAGAPNHTVGSNAEQGAAYAFVKSGTSWSQRQELTSSDGEGGDEFGWSIAVDGSTILVGAPTHPGPTGPGAAYVFVQSGKSWSQQQELTASDGAEDDELGRSVAVSGSTILVGAPFHQVGSNGDQGAAYLFAPVNTLASFDYTDGAYPTAFIEASDGNFYGTTDKGGQSGTGCNKSCGTIFEITPKGKLTTVAEFDGTDGNGPTGLVQSSSKDFYGTTSYGGAYGGGTVFQLTGGTLSTLYNFCEQTNCPDGAIPWGGLVLGANGNYYGTTPAGGGGACSTVVGPGCGTVFMITTGGALTTLHSFVGTDGAYPYSKLVLASDENFYGTTDGGGTYGYGTVFKITSEGAFSSIYSFTGTTDGAYPSAGLVQAKNGNFYGTTSAIPAVNLYNGPSCTPAKVGDGTVFEITSGGSLTTLHTFGGADGAFPFPGVIQGADGNFYGVTSCGGANGDGTIFQLTEAGTLNTLHTFAGTDGTFPFTALVQAKDGTFYGTTAEGGADDYGTVFSLSSEAQATLTPATHTFPKTKVGDTSAAYKFTLKNNLPTTLTGISYSTAAPFAVSASTCSTTLESKKSCTISVTFSPTQTGTATGTLSVSDSANNSPQAASLSGTGD
jgi:uncharacterized repeat protein (TIGR03803 family)